MNREAILKKVEEIIRATTNVEIIKEEDRLREEIGLDSLDKIHFSMDLEEKFNIKEIPEHDFNPLVDIKGVIDYLETKL